MTTNLDPQNRADLARFLREAISPPRFRGVSWRESTARLIEQLADQDLVGHQEVDPAGGDVSEELLQRRAVHRAAGIAAIVVMLRQNRPALGRPRKFKMAGADVLVPFKLAPSLMVENRR